MGAIYGLFFIFIFIFIIRFSLSAMENETEQDREILKKRIEGIHKVFKHQSELLREYNGVVFLHETLRGTPKDYIRGEWFSPKKDTPEFREFYGVVCVEPVVGYALIESDNYVYVVLKQ